MLSKLICWLFFHRTKGDKWTGAEYMDCKVGVRDGIGRVHATIYADCARCGERFRVGQIHVPHIGD